MKYSSPYKIIVFTLISIFIYSGVSFSAPSGGNVSHGDANISQSGGNTTINQNSDKAIINWGSFDIGALESVIFNQKNGNSIVLNRVNGAGASIINGSLSANGKVFILNSNGILIGGGASINTGSFLASTGKMSDKDFLNGNYHIHSASKDIINNGSIVVDNYGYAALLGRKVVNNGVISANLGRVEIASGEAFRVSFYDNNLIGVSIEKGAADAYISNTGKITAEGGTIYMSAKGLSDLLKSTVNNKGVIYAGSITKDDGGRVVLSAEFGDVNNNSLIDVSSDVGKAGNVEIYGNDIVVESEDAVIDASGESGGNVYLKASTNVEVKDKATITASGTDGDGGRVSVLSKGVLFFDKGTSLFSQSVTGNGGFIEVSSVDGLHLKGTANALSESGEHGTFMLDVYNLVITDTKLASRTLITTVMIDDINTALANTPNKFILSAVNISMDPNIPSGKVIGVASGGVGDLSFIASGSINLVSPNINVDKLTMIAGSNINLSNDPTKTSKIVANNFNLTSLYGNTTSIGVELTLGNLELSSPEGSVDLDSLINLTGMKLSGVVAKDLKLKSTTDTIKINIDKDLTVGNSISFNLPGIGSELDSIGNAIVTTKTLNLFIPKGSASIRNASFEELTADISILEITNSSIGVSPSGTFESPSIIIKDLKVEKSFSYTQNSIADVVFESIDDSAILLPTLFKLKLGQGKLVLPFEVALKYFTPLNIADASAIVFKTDGVIDLSGAVVGGVTGKTGSEFFAKFGSGNNSSSAKLLSFEAGKEVIVKITDKFVNSSLNMLSKESTVTAACTSSSFCIMASISAEAKKDISLNGFGTKSYSAKSQGGNIGIHMDKLPDGTAGMGTPSVTFANLETSGDGTITLTSLLGALVGSAPINILNLKVGSGGLFLSLQNTPSVNIISKETDNLDIRFASGNRKFGSFSVVSEGTINFVDNFDFGNGMIFLSINSKNGDIILNNSTIETVTSISLTANNVTGPGGSVLELQTGGGAVIGDEYIALNILGDNEVEFDINALNNGVLNLNGNLKVNINSNTTVASAGGSSTSMTGNIIIDGNNGGYKLTLKDTANINSFLAEGVGDVVLDPTFQATATEEFSINSSGAITSEKGLEGEKAWIHADHISLIASTIGGKVGGVSILPTPENYTDSAIMVEANTGYFKATSTLSTNQSIIDIGSADFMSSLFKYQFFPAPAVDTLAFLNGLNIKSTWYDDLNISRNDYYLYNPDLRYRRYIKYDIYDDILALGDALIISEILYPKYIHAKYKVGNSIFLK